VVNNDIHIPDNDFIMNVKNSILKLPENWGFMGVKVKNIDGSIFQYDPLKTDKMFDLFVFNTMIGTPLRPFFRRPKNIEPEKTIIESEVVSGSCFAFNTKAVKQIGAFDPFTFLYGEERILAIKYKKAGYTGFIDRSIEVIHNESATTKRIPEFVYVQRLRSEIYYFKEILKEPPFKLKCWIMLRCTDSFLRIFIKRITPNTFSNTIKMYKKFFNEGI
jgi:GT2 family glycosyltransferase